MNRMMRALIGALLMVVCARDVNAQTAAVREIQDQTLSPDGRWLLYELAPCFGCEAKASAEDKRVEAILRSTSSDVERRYDMAPGGHASFGPTGAWIAFTKDAAVVAVEVATGRTREFAGARAFVFNGLDASADWLALSSGSGKTSTTSKVDLELVRLASNVDRRFANVTAFAFNAAGDRLAVTDDAGLHVYACDERGIQEIATVAGGDLTSLVWSKPGRAVAAIRRGTPERAPAVVVATGLDKTPVTATFSAENLQGFPQASEIAPEPMLPSSGRYYATREALTWRDDERGLFVGVRPTRAAAAKTARVPTVEKLVLWHAADLRTPAEKQREVGIDATRSFLGFVSLADHRFKQLADESLAFVTANPSGPGVLAFDDRAYERDRRVSGRFTRDMYWIDLASGERRLIARALRIPYQPSDAYVGPALSPDGHIVVFMEEGDFWAYDGATGQRRRLAADVPFHLYDPAHIEAAPGTEWRAYHLQGWTRDGRGVLLSDGWDVWLTPLDGGATRSLTRDGRAQHVRYQRSDFTSITIGHDTALTDGIVDTSKPVYFTFRDSEKRRTGLVRSLPGRDGLEMLRSEEAQLEYRKARRADVYTYSHETALEYPEIRLSQPDWSPGRALTHVNPPNVISAGTRWLTYRSKSGETLHGALYLPSNYQPGHTYPMIVTVYEMRSYPHLHRFSGFPDAFYDQWTTQGYAVLYPDIRPKLGAAGPSAVDAVTAAVDAAVATGTIDRDHLGLEGFSYGGYESLYIATRTHIFKAAVPGGVISNLWSAYGRTYNPRSHGVPGSAIMEIGQNYLGAPWWDAWDATVDSSPLYHVRELDTPLLIYQGTNDAQTPFTEAEQFFTSARRAGKKNVVLLEYTDEGHSSAPYYRNPASARDAVHRIHEFFDHFLKGAPAPDWWTQGVSYPLGTAPAVPEPR